MHYSSFDSMRRAVKNHVVRDPDLGQRPLRVLDVGGADVNGSYRTLFRFQPTEYVVADVADEPGVDVRLDGSCALPLDDRSFDVVVSGQTLEHVGTFWRLFAEMARVVKDDGVILVAVPSTGPVHRYPVDCYRFNPDAMEALAADNGLVVAGSHLDARGPFHDLVTVFRRSLRLDLVDVEPLAYVPSIDDDLQNDAPDTDVPDVEKSAGDMVVIPTVLNRIHAAVEPRFYFETGVYLGGSLAQAKCPSIGIDPAPQVSVPLEDFHEVAVSLSDDFFLDPAQTARLGPLDLVYIDGMHLLENALMDFMNVERHAHPGSVILVDDIYPNHPLQARRQRCTRHWTGDVWKIIPILQIARPDLVVIPLDTVPTGTLLVLGADPTNTTLWDGFDYILGDALASSEVPPDHILDRRHALSPRDPLLRRMLRMMQTVRTADDPVAEFAKVRRLVSGAYPRRITRKVS